MFIYLEAKLIRKDIHVSGDALYLARQVIVAKEGWYGHDEAKYCGRKGRGYTRSNGHDIRLAGRSHGRKGVHNPPHCAKQP